MNLEDALEEWLNTPAESECLEFKEAKGLFSRRVVLEYCVAIANEHGGHLILGVTDSVPRKVVGTGAFPSPSSLNEIKQQIFEKLRFRVEIHEVKHVNGRVLIFKIPGRHIGQAIELEGKYLMRVGESVQPMTPDMLKNIFAEGEQQWCDRIACAEVSSGEVIELLDTDTWFRLTEQPHPTNQDATLEKFELEGFIRKTAMGWEITNLAAILLAKNLDKFSPELARKAYRFIIYDGKGKQKTRSETAGTKGYAVGFEDLVNLVYTAAPKNRVVEEVLRKEIQMFPKNALRELITNALIHQDFQISGASVMIEMYDDRVEISNPGPPPILIDRFIDEYLSRNEKLAGLMRRMGICEERGSGVDKVIVAVETYQLPAPNFRKDNVRTFATLFAHQDFSKMRQSDRIRACYQHCALCYVKSDLMTNTSLRERFGLSNSRPNVSIVSQIILLTRRAGWIKPEKSDQGNRYARYLPKWA